MIIDGLENQILLFTLLEKKKKKIPDSVGDPFSLCIRPELSKGSLIFQYFPHIAPQNLLYDYLCYLTIRPTLRRHSEWRLLEIMLFST